MGALDYAFTTLNVLGATLQVIPFVGDNLKGVVELATKICETVQTMKDNREAYEQLVDRITRLLAAIANVVQKATPEKLKSMEGNVSHLLQLLQEMQSGLQVRLGRGSASPAAGKLGRVKSLFRDKGKDFLNVSADQEEIKKYQQKLDEAVQEFGVTSQMRVELNLDDVRSLSTNIAKRVEEMQREQSKDAMNAVLASLKPVFSARWDDAHVAACMTDTRTQLLADIAAWAVSSSAPLVFWLNGLAGTGKSTVARTMCERLEAQGALAASFFVTRQVSERRAAPNIIRTLAYQLARRQRPVADALCTMLRDTPDLAVAENLPKLVAGLLSKPAEAMSRGVGLVVVIDALDECEEDSQGRYGGDLVPLLIRSLLQLPGRLKLLITSRAEPTIRRMFEDLSVDALQTVVQLHDLDRAMVRNDIKIYLTRSCKAIVETRRELSLEDWPSPADLETLVDLSDVLFVFASTAIRFLNSPRQSPRARLDFMLARRDDKLGSPFRFLDQLYMQVLENAVKTDEDDEHMLCDRLRSVMGGVVVMRYPLPVEAYAILLHMDRDEVQLAAESLSAFLLFRRDESVRIFHPSFPDFITNPKRCDDVRFRVSVADHHRQLAHGCLVLLNRHLCYDIANLGDPSIANADVADLDGKLDTAVRSRRTPGIKHDSRLDYALPGALQYACRYWASHLGSTLEADVTLRSELATFCDRNLFHWLELLSLIGAVNGADQSLRVAVVWCENYMNDVQAVDLLRDTLRTIQTYRSPIRSHALHVYHSAFVTMPRCPLLSQMSQQYGQAALPQMLSPRDASWGPWVTVLDGHEDAVLSVTVSADGRRIASGARDATVRVWDAITFEALAVLRGHESWVYSVAFWPDGKRLVSTSFDKTIRVWDADSYNAEPIAVLRVEDTWGMSVAVSPDGNHVVSGSWDGALRIWDAVTYDPNPRILLGHTTRIKVVAYSPDGRRIVSCADEASVRIWDAETGEQLGVMKHESVVNSVAFSWDGARIVSGSADCTARVWDASKYTELARVDECEFVTAAAFSPDGKWIVLGLSSSIVRVWDAQTCGDSEGVTVVSDELATLKGHGGDVNCVVFSPDGRSCISAANDCTVRVWATSPEIFQRRAKTDSDGSSIASGSEHSAADVFSEPENLNELWTAEGDTVPLRSLIYSADQKRIASGSYDGTVRLWDAINSGPPLAKFEHNGGISNALAISPDGTRLASGVQCGLQVLLRVWDAIEYSDQSATLAPDYKMHIATAPYSLVNTLTFTADGSTLALRTESGDLYAWKRSEKRQDVADEVWTEVPIELEDMPLHDGPIFSCSSTDWLECTLGTRTVPVIWLPFQHRPRDTSAVATCGTRAVILGPKTRQVTVLDLSRALGNIFPSL